MRKQESSCSACNGDLRDKTRIRVPLDGHLARRACIWQHNLCFLLSFFFFFHFSSLTPLNIYSAVIGLCHILINWTYITFSSNP
jgi:hypothetical protein